MTKLVLAMLLAVLVIVPRDAHGQAPRDSAIECSKGEPQRAIDACSEYLKAPVYHSSRLDALALYNRGTFYDQRGQAPAAIADFTASLKLNPADADVYIARGIASMSIPRYDDAEADFRKAMRLDPYKDLAYRYLGNVYVKRGEYEEALFWLSAAIELDPRNPGTLSDRGFANKMAGNSSKALQDYNQALKLDPANSSALSRKASLEAGLKKSEKDQLDELMGATGIK